MLIFPMASLAVGTTMARRLRQKSVPLTILFIAIALVGCREERSHAMIETSAGTLRLRGDLQIDCRDWRIAAAPSMDIVPTDVHLKFDLLFRT
jgi:hypothetical protein